MTPKSLAELHKTFLRERKYIANLSPKTIKFLHWSWEAFIRVRPDIASVFDMTQENLNEFIIGMRERGMKPTTCNTYIRGVNGFITWLTENEYLTEKLSMKMLRVAKPLPKTVKSDVLAQIIGYAPKVPGQIRIRAMLLTIIDTGLRINEVITMRTEDVDLAGLSLKVLGKGSRERMVPFSPELRRVFTKYEHALKVNAEGHYFESESGKPLMYRNLLRDYQRLCDKLGIPRPGGFHRLRHTFATAWMARGGNQFDLKFALGHRELSTTDIYVHATANGLREARSRMGLGSGLLQLTSP